MSDYIKKPATSFSDETQDIINGFKEKDYVVLVGTNNSGKSFILQDIQYKWGKNVKLTGPNRYQNFTIFGSFAAKSDKKGEIYNQFSYQYNNSNQNIDHIQFNLQESISELTDSNRGRLIDIVKILLGVDIEIAHTVDGNSMSQNYIKCDGYNLSYSSSGLRLILSLLTALLDSDYDTFLIDEPELGISPEVQAKISDFLFDLDKRKHYFPHIKTIIFATHSIIFLDRKIYSNNYSVHRINEEIFINKIASRADFNNIHFLLLGNRLETLMLPSAIVLVEGKTDKQFINFVFAKRFPNKKISVQFGDGKRSDKKEGGDGHIVSLGRKIAETLDIQSSPYKARTFVVLDKKNSTKKGTLETYGFEKNNIIVFSENGIEYYYPAEIIDEIFGKEGKLKIDGDFIKKGDVSKSKDQLCNEVILKINEKSKYHDDFEDFLIKIGKAMGI